MMSKQPSNQQDSDDEANHTESIPRNKRLKTGHLQLCSERKLIIILERSQLETVKNGKDFTLLCSDKHKHLLSKSKKNADSFPRPDITHQCLLMLQDSVINRAGLLQVFIHTERNVLIEINPQTRIPRTYDRFAGLMVQLLHKMSVRAAEGHQKLLKVIKNPVSDHLPVGCRRIGTSHQAKEVVDIRSLVPDNGPIVFVVGAIAHGQVNVDYTEELVSFSNYPLSAAWAVTKICDAFESVWKVEDK
ncbi:ribosomal RNA small subunit methyltransferase NEP1-like [Paramacrobiotus metropolitanus]|uniref:ribosomal RNA small subunit methyltransferase NEP1-like n=1 Tax=Paramacrobiotus metropolitanus TaxID=2943436 RepID=UPI002445A4E4|nr:ribosomal RNA small subunit methyltransferase NEP1-like [Paramacrobiotus metropolitanus]